MRKIASIAMIALLAAPAFAAPRMPPSFEVAITNGSGKTWCQIGTVNQPFAMARATIKSAMQGQGYSLVHDIAENEAASRRLQLWRKKDEDIILMLWQEDLYSTGVSWGISNREGGNPEENPPQTAEGWISGPGAS